MKRHITEQVESFTIGPQQNPPPKQSGADFLEKLGRGAIAICCLTPILIGVVFLCFCAIDALVN